MPSAFDDVGQAEFLSHFGSLQVSEDQLEAMTSLNNLHGALALQTLKAAGTGGSIITRYLQLMEDASILAQRAVAIYGLADTQEAPAPTDEEGSSCIVLP